MSYIRGIRSVPCENPSRRQMMSQPNRVSSNVAPEPPKKWAVRFLLLIAGLGGLLYGIDWALSPAVLPYLEATAARPGT